MNDYAFLADLEPLDANSENEIVYNTNQAAGGAASSGYSSLAEMKRLANSLQSSGRGYLKSILGKSRGGAPEPYNTTSLLGSSDGSSVYKPAGYQRGYSSSYVGQYNSGGSSYVGQYNSGGSSYPGGKAATSYYGEGSSGATASSSAPLRPLGPSGPRVMGMQANNGQTRQVMPMDAHGYQWDRDNPSVEYMEAERAARYAVEIGARLKRRGAVFSTKEMRKAYASKVRSDPDKYAPPGQAVLGKNVLSKEDARRWGQEALIWVCASQGAGTKPIFYSGVGKLNKIHHSSFTGGASVIGAGEWIVEGGKLLYVSANSGHYRPTLDAFYAAMLHMSQAFLPETKVLMWDTKANIYVHRGVKDFIAAPSYSGLYKVHRDA